MYRSLAPVVKQEFGDGFCSACRDSFDCQDKFAGDYLHRVQETCAQNLRGLRDVEGFEYGKSPQFRR